MQLFFASLGLRPMAVAVALRGWWDRLSDADRPSARAFVHASERPDPNGRRPLDLACRDLDTWIRAYLPDVQFEGGARANWGSIGKAVTRLRKRHTGALTWSIASGKAGETLEALLEAHFEATDRLQYVMGPTTILLKPTSREVVEITDTPRLGWDAMVNCFGASERFGLEARGSRNVGLRDGFDVRTDVSFSKLGIAAARDILFDLAMERHGTLMLLLSAKGDDGVLQVRTTAEQPKRYEQESLLQRDLEATVRALKEGTTISGMRVPGLNASIVLLLDGRLDDQDQRQFRRAGIGVLSERTRLLESYEELTAAWMSAAGVHAMSASQTPTVKRDGRGVGESATSRHLLVFAGDNPTNFLTAVNTFQPTDLWVCHDAQSAGIAEWLEIAVDRLRNSSSDGAPRRVHRIVSDLIGSGIGDTMRTMWQTVAGTKNCFLSSGTVAQGYQLARAEGRNWTSRLSEERYLGPGGEELPSVLAMEAPELVQCLDRIHEPQKLVRIRRRGHNGTVTRGELDASHLLDSLRKSIRANPAAPFASLVKHWRPFDAHSECFEAFVTWQIAQAWNAEDAVACLKVLSPVAKQPLLDFDGLVRKGSRYVAVEAKAYRGGDVASADNDVVDVAAEVHNFYGKVLRLGRTVLPVVAMEGWLDDDSAKQLRQALSKALPVRVLTWGMLLDHERLDTIIRDAFRDLAKGERRS